MEDTPAGMFHWNPRTSTEEDAKKIRTRREQEEEIVYYTTSAEKVKSDL